MQIFGGKPSILREGEKNVILPVVLAPILFGNFYFLCTAQFVFNFNKEQIKAYDNRWCLFGPYTIIFHPPVLDIMEQLQTI